MKAWTRIAIAMTMGMMMGGNVANAGFIVELSETATGVTQATSGGTANLNGLTYAGGFFTSTAGLGGSQFALGSGPTLNGYDGNITLSPGPIWATGGSSADSVTGSFVGIIATGSNLRFILAPTAPITAGILTIGPASASFDGKTFADLGFTPGDSFVYSWGSGSNADSVTYNIVGNVVPEPSSYLLMGFGLCCITAYHYRRRMTVVAE
jgi:hypothetical protein